MVNLANILTGVRFFGTPVLVYLYLNHYYDLAFWLMLFLGSTDWLDGFVARMFKQETSFGKLFDPIADKTLMLGALAVLYYLGALPLWFVVLCSTRDVLIVIGGLKMMNCGYSADILPTKVSKINTLLQILCILVVTYHLLAIDLGEWLLFGKTVLLCLTSLFTIMSGVQYVKIFWRFLKNA